ncbi:DUF2270 domain-containing protein [Halomarina pelagica]|uniref:DUF2270 domain-containing protein n=1 Tax=Halomarina pelagica TaxID=2961599 RepID=UPI0020C368AC|nr:DUF2270 domain-containing protein [Halomarina sp. BND7]
MVDESTDSSDFDPREHDAREVASETADDPERFLSLMPHYYRGEVSNMKSLMDRMDLTVDWAIAVLVALLALSFESPDRPPHLLLIGMGAMTMFLLFDVRRYRTFDATRSRVRMIEENLFANAFDPRGAERAEWRGEMSDDLRAPTLKVTTREAVARRLRRVYLPLLTVLLIAWAYRITVFVSGETWTETAAVPGVPGTVVTAGVVLYYVVLVAIAYWPKRREAMGEFHDERPGEWKRPG